MTVEDTAGRLLAREDFAWDQFETSLVGASSGKSRLEVARVSADHQTAWQLHSG